MIEVLVSAGASIDAATLQSGQTSLRVAIRDRKLEAASALIRGGASLKAALNSEERRHDFETSLIDLKEDTNLYSIGHL